MFTLSSVLSRCKGSRPHLDSADNAPMEAPAAQPIPRSRPSLPLFIGLAGAGLGVVAIVAIGLVGWGQPGSAAYETYEMLNRLAALPMLLMAGVPIALLGHPAIRDERRGFIAALAVLVGLLAMAIGTSLEFWAFTDDPYGGAGSEGRIAAYLLGTFVGGVVALVGMALVGTWGLRRETLPRSAAMGLIALPVALVVLPFTPLSPSIAIPIGVAVVALGLLAPQR